MLLFLDPSTDPSLAISGSYKPGQVIVSYIVAGLASYAGLLMSERVGSSDSVFIRWLWLGTGAFTMGIGIWAMHFLGMLAFVLPIPVTYDMSITVFSAIPAMLASAAALFVISSNRHGWQQKTLAGTILGVGIGVMHFSGMSAMHLNAVVQYDVKLFSLSILVAAGLGIAALFAQDVEQGMLGFKKSWGRFVSAVLMGLAITSMHYTAMSATYCFPAPEINASDVELNPFWLSVAVTVITVLIILLAIAATVVDQRLQSASQLVGITHRRLVEAIESISDGFFLLDKDGNLVVCNDRYKDYSHEIADLITPGVPFKDLLRASVYRGRYPAAIGREEEFIKNRLEQMKSSTLETEQQLADGRWILIRDYHTKNNETVCIRTDITQLKTREAELIIAKEKAELSDRTKSEFLAHMSHELRTPLNSIIGYSQMITEQIYGAISQSKYTEYAMDIHNSGRHLLNLINDILDLSKIEAGEHILSESDLDIGELLSDCVRMVRGKKEAATISINFHPGDIPLNIYADERLIKQIILNLLSNAVKYNVKNGIVDLSAILDLDRSLLIKIADTGIGIAEHDIAKVLEPFGQARLDAHKAHEGTGLGLSLSKQLTELHGGLLSLESVPGKGTTASIKFPPERTRNALVMH